MKQPLLSVQGLKTEFNQAQGLVKAVDGVSFDIAEGETFALVGESGCGKSVLALSVMRLLSNNAKITAGKVIYRGTDLLQIAEKQMRAVRGFRIAMIFQDPMTSLNPVMSVGEQIGEAVLLHKKLPRSAVKERVVELIKQVGIADAEARYASFPHQLSGGMMQRVMIAMALANEPDLLIADEPTTALDVTIQAQILELLKDLQRELGMSLWIISHDLGIVSDIADRVAVMYAGQLVEVATRDSFFNQAAHPYSQRLFAALPKMDKRDKALVTLPGSVPRLSQTFNGCRFAERCDYQQPACTSIAKVAWHSVADDHLARCLRLDEVVAKPINTPEFIKQQTTSTSNKVLQVNNLKIHFAIKKGILKRTVGFVKAVDGVSFDLVSGGTTALVGESGCGKTTLGKGLLKLLPITSGEVYYQEKNLVDMPEQTFRSYREQLQIIFQDPFSSMNPRMLVIDILQEGLQALKPTLSNLEVEAQCAYLLQKVGLNADVLYRYPHEFSGGQRQRICIARALAVKPSIIVCDEPTSALDVSVQAQVLNLLQQLQQEQGLSYLFITHDLSVVSYLADTVAVMYLGRIVEYGTVEEVLNAPAHPYTKALINAVPSWDNSVQKTINKLPDTMPSAANPPSGCHFHTRCAQVMPICSTVEPKNINVSASHSVCCLQFDDTAVKP
ncbi:MAG: ABC transporter ATP-binding protein [Cycloclasticus sp.]|nr:ABC transporter ATP-binding protein [Cycloclasticus sp.]MBQ0789350.1 ABC transporter ATP-binding protein [Cycloclasticus sp.]